MEVLPPAMQYRLNAVLKTMQPDLPPFAFGLFIRMAVYHVFFPLATPVVVALEGGTAFMAWFGAYVCDPFALFVTILVPCCVVIAVVMWAITPSELQAQGAILDTELALMLTFHVARNVVIGMKYGFMHPGQVRAMQREHPLVGLFVNFRSMLATAWIHPHMSVIRHEVHLAARRLGIDSAAYTLSAPATSEHTLRVLLQPALQYEAECRAAWEPGAAPVHDSLTSPPCAHPGREESGAEQDMKVPASAVAAVEPVEAGRPSPSASLSRPILRVEGGAVHFSLEGLVAAIIHHAQPTEQYWQSKLCIAAGWLHGLLFLPVLAANGPLGELSGDPRVIVGRIANQIATGVLFWNLALFAVAGVVEYRRRGLMVTSLSALLHHQHFGNASSMAGVQKACDAAVLEAIASGAISHGAIQEAVACILSQGHVAGGASVGGLVDDSDSSARGIARPLPSALTGLSGPERAAVLKELHPHVATTGPLFTLWQHNAVSFLRARQLVFEFGRLFTRRLAIYQVAYLAAILYLTIVSLISLLSEGVAPGTSPDTDIFYIFTAVNLPVWALVTVAMIMGGAGANAASDDQIQTLTDASIAFRELQHALLSLDGAEFEGADPLPGAPDTAQTSLETSATPEQRALWGSSTGKAVMHRLREGAGAAVVGSAWTERSMPATATTTAVLADMREAVEALMAVRDAVQVHANSRPVTVVGVRATYALLGTFVTGLLSAGSILIQVQRSRTE